jgi:hypothetical protein
MATIIDCNTDDGRVVYVNLDNIITFASRGDEDGSEIRFVGGERLIVATSPEHFLGIGKRKAKIKRKG